MPKRTPALVTCCAVALLAGCAAKPPAPIADAAAPIVPPQAVAAASGAMVLADAAAGCVALTGAHIPGVRVAHSEYIVEGIAFPIRAGSRHIDGKALPAHCRVDGELDTGDRALRVAFEWRAPTQWNARTFYQGRDDEPDTGVSQAVGRGSGAAGLDDNALGRGYAVWAATAMATEPQRAGRVARSLHDGVVAAKALAQSYYGRESEHSYFVGCGVGGRDGLLLAQRWPTALDGVVAIAPALRQADAAQAKAWMQRQLLTVAPRGSKHHRELRRAFSSDELFTVAQGILKRCDALDGAADGFVMDMAACRFDPVEVQCRKRGPKPCLRADKVKALRGAMAGEHDAAGKPVYVAWPWDPGIAGPGWRASMLSETPAAAPAIDEKVFGAAFDGFAQRGGKLLLVHGAADPVSSAWVSVDFQQRLDATRGAAAGGFARTFIVPGMNHCAGGPATDRFDALAALVDWVENGKPPERIEARGSAVLHDETRPLCPWPKVARYRGTGQLNDSVSYECR